MKWWNLSEATLIFPPRQTFADSSEDSWNSRSERVRETNDFQTCVLTEYTSTSVNGEREGRRFLSEIMPRKCLHPHSKLRPTSF